MSVEEKLKASFFSNVNLKGLCLSVLKDVLEQSLREIVESSENKFDDVAFQALWPLLEVKVTELIEAKVPGLQSPEPPAAA